VNAPVPLAVLLEGLPYECVQGDLLTPISQVCEDSRHCTAGALFVALRGLSVDGHAFIPEAVRRGAVAVLCQELPATLPEGCTVVWTQDTRKALAVVAHRFFGEPSRRLRLVGVTGTNGKTTTTFFVRSVLEGSGMRTAVVGTTGVYLDTQWYPLSHTTPTPVEVARILAWAWQNGAEAVAMEVSSHALEQQRVEALHFAAGLFTNLSHDHLDYHGTMEAYARAKRRLFELLPPDACAIACERGDGWGSWMLEAAACRARFRIGCGTAAEVELQLLQSTPSGIRWQMRFPGADRWIPFESPLLGEFNAANAALAIVLGWAWGIEMASLQEAVARASAPPGRMEPVPLPTGALALVDYAHTPDALRHVLQAARQLCAPGGRLLCVFGCGGNRDRAKRPHMGAIAAQWADIIVLTSDNPRTEPPLQILQDILEGIPAEARQRTHVVPERAQALREAVAMSRSGDVVVVAGKGHENYQILGEQVIPFSDRAVLEALAVEFRSVSQEQQP